MQKITVHTGRPYDILIDDGLLEQAGDLVRRVSGAKRICLISDSNVYPLYGDRVVQALESADFQVCTLVFDAGEASKKPETVLNMVNYMAREGLTRGDLVVALGGGVCGDMAGFAAAIYLRGIDFVQIPTTLLAQVDSSVGGKTGVDLPMGKNLCGAFHQPILVLIDPQVLRTLPDVFFSDGMGEVIKYGCICSAELFALLEQANAKDRIHEIIYACVDMKRVVVEHDEKEAGERALLNFGHTAGHAIEKLWNYQTVTHGAAVGIGMVLAARAGEGAGLTEPGTADRIAALLQKYNLPVADTHSIDEIVDAMQADKKRTADGMKLVLLRKIGDSFIDPVDLPTLRTMFGGGACK